LAVASFNIGNGAGYTSPEDWAKQDVDQSYSDPDLLASKIDFTKF
jgi:hypothetical protein